MSLTTIDYADYTWSKARPTVEGAYVLWVEGGQGEKLTIIRTFDGVLRVKADLREVSTLPEKWWGKLGASQPSKPKEVVVGGKR